MSKHIRRGDGTKRHHRLKLTRAERLAVGSAVIGGMAAGAVRAVLDWLLGQGR